MRSNGLALAGITTLFTLATSATVVAQHVTLTASNAASDDQFGFSAELDGTRLVVGATQHPSPNPVGPGTAYVFEMSGTTWTETAQLLVSLRSA